jgi:hypothetical protein
VTGAAATAVAAVEAAGGKVTLPAVEAVLGVSWRSEPGGAARRAVVFSASPTSGRGFRAHASATYQARE